MVIAFHIGTDPVHMDEGEQIGITYRGPGGAVLNYTETTFSGQRAAMKMVASGALDRHPEPQGARSPKAARRGCRSSATA